MGKRKVSDKLEIGLYFTIFFEILVFCTIVLSGCGQGQEKAVEQFGYEREQKGREEGGFEMARRTAANMFKDGEPIDKIARFLEFPPETILSWVGKS